MKSELSFLMDLFLSDEVPLPIKKVITKRIREVEENLAANPVSQRVQLPVRPSPMPQVIAQQAPSMQRIMEANSDLIPAPVIMPAPPVPVTSAAASALQRRADIIRGASSEKPEPGRTSPRKF